MLDCKTVAVPFSYLRAGNRVWSVLHHSEQYEKVFRSLWPRLIRRGAFGANEVPHGVAERSAPVDQALVRGVVQVRGSRQNPEQATVRCAHQRGAILRIEIENQIVSLA